MTASVPSNSAGTLAEDVFKKMMTCQDTALVYGTVACMDTSASNTDLDAVSPDNANAGIAVGLVMSQGSLSSGAFGAPVAGDPLQVQRFGQAVGLLATNQTITRGQKLGAVSGTGGQLGAYIPGQGMKFVGYAAQSKTTTSTALYIAVDLNCNPRDSHSMAVSGFASTTFQNATKYLSAPGTGAASSTAVELFVVPPGGGFIANLVASDGTAPGGSDSDAYAVYRNPLSAGAYGGFAITALTCTISASGVEAKDATHSVAVNEGDILAIGVVASATSLGASRRATFQFFQAP